MNGPKHEQAGLDLLAYVATLDAAEALGEAVHLADHMLAIFTAAGNGRLTDEQRPDAMAFIITMGYGMAHVIRRYRDVEHPSVVAPAAHDLHSCTLVGRIVAAQR